MVEPGTLIIRIREESILSKIKFYKKNMRRLLLDCEQCLLLLSTLKIVRLTLYPGAVEILGFLVRELWREDETTFYLGTGEEGFVSWSDSY